MSKDPALRELGEFAIIERLKAQIAQAAPHATEGAVVLGIGDDAAVYRPTEGMLQVVTTDVQIAGRHFLPSSMTAEEIGRRAMEVNLSDLAAMGALPRYAFASLGLPGDMRASALDGIYRGFLSSLAEARGDPARSDADPAPTVIGGNLSASGSEWFMNLTLIGEVEPGRELRRDGARVGDLLFVSGSPGRSAAGLDLLLSLGPASPELGARVDRREAWIAQHPWARSLIEAYIAPRARLALGRKIATGGASSAIDLSDGLALDLEHIAIASSVSIEVEAAALPASRDPLLLQAAEHLAHASRSAEEWLRRWSFGPSDDYELSFTVGQEAQLEEPSITRVGQVVQGSGVRYLGLEGDAPRGWDHFAG